MKSFITIILGLIVFSTITAFTAAVFAVTFRVGYTDVVHCDLYIAFAIFIGIPTATFVAGEIHDKNLTNLK